MRSHATARVNSKTHEPTLYRDKYVDGPLSARARIGDKTYLNFAGFQYLALSGLREIRQAVVGTLRRRAPLAKAISAHTGALDPDFDAVEASASTALQTEAALYFASGYFTGSVCLSAMGDQVDFIAIDEASHYNLFDAAKLSGLPVAVFRHCDANALSDVLKRHHGARYPIVMTDGAFAASGVVPPLEEYAMLLEPRGGRLLVDEAHSFGVVGAGGRGAAEHCGVERIATVGATLSKAYCTQGAVIGCSAETAIRLRTTPVIRGASAGSPLLAAAASASLDYVGRHPTLRSEMRDLADYLRAKLRSLGFFVPASPAPIVSFRTGRRQDMERMQSRLLEQGILIVHGLGYAGCDDDGLLRCSIFRDHSFSDLDMLVAAIREL
jgi:8-amino-7-oxononanoate synthase